MKVRVLGPVEAHTDAGELHLARRQQRLILGILAIEVNQVVSSDRLIDLIWGHRPPERVRAIVQSRVSELRAVFVGHLEGEQRLVTHANGYMFASDPELVDLHEFRALVHQAHGSLDREKATDALRRALGLWRGDVLGGWLPAEAHIALCEGVEGLRLTAAQELFEVELELGHGHLVVDALKDLAMANPSRERLTALAMAALHRMGRSADSLQLFEHGRRWLADELGVDPSADIQRLHLSIMRGEPDPGHSYESDIRSAPISGTPIKQAPNSDSVDDAGLVYPSLLPGDIPDFTGRIAESRLLCEALTQDNGRLRLVVISGPGGVGKTALSVHVAHQIRHEFPHGQLYIDLHGIDVSRPLLAGDALARFLRALGVESALPESLDERAEMYRDLVSSRRMLIVLDNARDIEQVRALIPGSSTCATIITSRFRLGGAIGGDALELTTFNERQALDLVSRIAGAPRVALDPAAATELVELCGGLPLTIRIAAARLVAKPHWSLGRLVDRLSDERKRLNQFSYGDLDVRASIALSYTGLPSAAQTLLCSAGDLDLPHIDVWTSAALLDMPPAEAEEYLEHLYDAQLIDAVGPEAGGYSRYKLHDLVRLFAQERALADLSPLDRAAARHRAAAAWLYLVEMAYSKVYGRGSENVSSPADRHIVDERLAALLTADPQLWLVGERQCILGMTRVAASDRLSAICWGLASTSFSLFEMSRNFDDSQQMLDVAFDLAVSLDDTLGEAVLLCRIGTLSSDRNDVPQAFRHLSRAADIFQQINSQHGVALAKLQMALAYRSLDQTDHALACLEEAVPALRNCGDKGGEAFALRNLAQIHIARADYSAADAYLTAALACARKGESRRREAQVLYYQGMLRLSQDQCHDAERLFLDVLMLTTRLGDKSGQIQAHRGLSFCHERGGDRLRAEASLRTALSLAHQPKPTLMETMVQDDLARLLGNTG